MTFPFSGPERDRNRPLDGVDRLRRRMRRGRRRSILVLPTLCTLGNLLCGFLAVFFASRPPDTVMLWNWTPLTFAAVFVFMGMLLDALDGRLARLTGATSDLGEQLDSMADMVTFGVAPAFLAVQLIGVGTPFASARHDYYFGRVALVVAAIYVACAALRLARFNLQTRLKENADHLSFLGLPSPGAAGTVASLILLHQHYLVEFGKQQAATVDLLPPPFSVRGSAVAMVLVMLLAALMMVSRFRYVHLANRYLRGRARFATIVRGVIVVALLAIRPREAVAAGFVIYALSAPALGLWRRLARKPIEASRPSGVEETPHSRRDVG